ncbi:S1 family peptidase [Vibrio sonorensis]|uniref:S1 family peptidase n=1 Tax=Vibrio sonorensis TaxID=1004316 RepID=UPI0008D99E7F|nr:serine protease [Vibrio sonorensis]
MKTNLALVFALLASNAVANDISAYIVNGSGADVNNFPSTATLFYDSHEIDSRYSTTSYCGATVIDAYHVLTAAHCVYDSEAARLFTIVSPKLQDTQTYNPNFSPRYRVSSVYIRSDYIDSEAEFLPNDIAILKLEAPMSNITPVAFSADKSYRNSSQSFVTVGHGSTSSNGNPYRGPLNKADLEYVSNDVCKGAFTNGNEKLKDSHLCFKGTPTTNSAICNGDSGGAVYWNNAGNLVQVGVTSFGPVICGSTPTASSVFTEVTDYRGWINSVVGGAVSPTYTANNDERNAHITKYGQINLSAKVSSSSSVKATSGGSSGGQWPLWLTFACAALGLVRKPN